LRKFAQKVALEPDSLCIQVCQDEGNLWKALEGSQKVQNCEKLLILCSKMDHIWRARYPKVASWCSKLLL